MTMRATTIHQRRMPVARGLMPLMAVVVAAGLTQPADAVETVTSFAPSTNTDLGVWFEFDVRAGGTASIVDLTGLGGDLENNQPLPIGAAKLTTNFVNGIDKAEVGVADNYGQAGSILSTLEIAYSWHKASNAGQNPNAAPSLKLTFFNPVCVDATNNPGLDCFGAFVYEPYQNGFGNFPTLDMWNTSSVDYTNGMWWWTGGFGSPNQGGGPANKTLQQWETELSGLSTDFSGAFLIVVSVGVGSFNNGQIGYFDDVSISHSFGGGFNESYDFEPPPPVFVDIKPGSCPNPFNRNSNGVVPVSVLGTDAFDASEIDISSVQICRGDGVGSCVSPNEGPPGPHSVFADTATPFEGEPCDCHELTGDGLIDLSLKFRTQNMVAAMQLDSEPAGAFIEMVVTGTTLDGVPFSASDCVVIVPPGSGQSNATLQSNVPDTYIEVTPLDLTVDSNGFANFSRAYYSGTVLTVTAPTTSQGRRFLRWRVDNVLQPVGVRTMEITVGENMTLKALYQRPARMAPGRPTEGSGDME